MSFYSQIVCPYKVDTVCSLIKGTLEECKICNWNLPLVYTNSTNVWQTCPICGGNGHVPGGFYNSVGGSSVTANVSEVCRTCNGKGIISSLTGTPPTL